MRQVIFFTLFCFSIAAWPCLSPTILELNQFFEQTSKWTEVESKLSFELATKRPIFLDIGLKKGESTSISWGTNIIKGQEISICWNSPSKKRIRITKGFFGVTLIKVQQGLLKSWIPFDGDLYYRKDKEVTRPELPNKSSEQTKNSLI